MKKSNWKQNRSSMTCKEYEALKKKLELGLLNEN